MTTLLVYGWYGRGNVGDELMGEALCSIFEPRGITLKFVDHITSSELVQSDGVLFGGGSILFGHPSIETDAMNMLQKNLRPTFYVGVGLETEVHPIHQSLMKIARVVITRSAAPWPAWCPTQTYGMPDLVYGLPQADAANAAKGILFIPNVEILPQHHEPHWKHIGWERFKDEFAQFLDDAINELHLKPTILLMCKNDTMDDAWPAAEIVARMRYRSTKYEVIRAPTDSLAVTNIIKDHSVVITQRYHGIILAQMSGVPHVSIDHHDKLKLAWPRKGISLPFYGFSKEQMMHACKLAMETPREQTRVSRQLYDGLADAVTQIVMKERNERVEPVRGSP